MPSLMKGCAMSAKHMAIPLALPLLAAAQERLVQHEPLAGRAADAGQGSYPRHRAVADAQLPRDDSVGLLRVGADVFRHPGLARIHVHVLLPPCIFFLLISTA